MLKTTSLNNNLRILYSPQACFIISAVFVLACFIFFPIVFEQNDDVMMKLIANGYFTGQPESHLVFINIIIGFILKWLYTFFSAVEWYSVLQITLFMTAFFSNVYCIVKYETLGKRLVLTLINIATLYFLSRLQFSYVSGFLAISAVISQFYGLSHDNKKLLAFSVPLMLLSALVRFEMFFFTYPVFFLVFLFLLNKKLSVKTALTGGILIGIAFLINQLSYKSNPDWDTYLTYNKARGAVTNNPNINPDDESIIKDLKLNVEDRTLLKNYIFTETLTEANLKKLVSSGKESRIPVSQTFMSAYSNIKAYLIAIIVLLLTALFTRRFNIAIAVILHIIMIYITVRYFNMVQYRILFPSFFGLVFLYVRSLDINESKPLSIILTALSLILLLIQAIEMKKNSFFSSRILRNIQKIENQLPEKNIYLVDPTSNHFLISRKAFETPKRKYIFFGWLTNFPYGKQQLPGYNSNLFRMAGYPLIISEANYNLLKPFIFNTNIYVISDDNRITPTFRKH